MSPKQEIYKPRLSKTLGAMVVTLILLLLLTGINVYHFVWKPLSNGIMISVNIILPVFIIPGLIIHLNYRKHSRNKYLLLTYKEISLVHKDQPITTLQNQSIKRIKLTESRHINSLFFGYSYFILEDEIGKQILIPSYIFHLTELRMSTLARLITAEVERENVFFPWIGKNAKFKEWFNGE